MRDENQLHAAIVEIVEYLLEHYKNEEKVRLIVLCGSFQKLYDKLKAHPSQKVIPLNFTDQMPDYLKACDLYLTKPGGLSSTEAAVAGVPLIHISPIPGCESKNLKCFKNRGMAIPAVKTKEELFRALDALDSEQARETMIRNQHKENRNTLPQRQRRTRVPSPKRLGHTRPLRGTFYPASPLQPFIW